MTTVVEDRQSEQVFIERAAAMRDQLRAHAVEAERNARLDASDVETMTEGGLTALSTRKDCGGSETSWRSLVDVVRILGQGDATAGWVAGVTNAGAFAASLFSEQARKEVWGDGQQHRFAGALTPGGSVEVVEGGVKLTGRWPYMSGGHHADWFLVSASLNGEPLGPTADVGMALLPREEVVIDDNWDVAGMSGTGSITGVLDGVFVPEHRLLRFSRYSADQHEGLFRTAIFPALSVGLVGSLIGEAEHALELVIQKAPSRNIATTNYMSQLESATFQAEVARAAQLIQTARITLELAADEMDRIVAEGRTWTEAEKTRNRADCAYVARTCWDAIDILASAHGTSTFANANPLSRMWRNLGVAARHAGLANRVGEELLGRELLGLPTAPISPGL